MKTAKFLFPAFFALLFLFTTCNEKRKKSDISNIKIQIKFLRFDQDIFQSDFEKIEDSVYHFHQRYGEFLDIFNFKIIKIGDYKNPAYADLLRGFITDYNMNKVYKVTGKEFEDFRPIQIKINEAFRYFKYYFPKMPIPMVVTYISGFNQSIVTSDTILGIGLDKYLGAKCEFYTQLGLTNYVRYNMHKNKIPTDCARAWAMTQFPMSDSMSNLLSNIIYQGKLVYFTKALLPDEPDSLIFGMSSKHLDWCNKYEDKMWTYLVENKMLYKTDYLTISKFINDGPFTKEFGKNSPGKAVVWIGWKIVNRYMERQANVDLKSFMIENDFQKILRLSKYKP